MAVVDDEVRLLTIPEVAERIGRTPKTVRNMIARGQLRAGFLLRIASLVARCGELIERRLCDLGLVGSSLLTLGQFLGLRRQGLEALERAVLLSKSGDLVREARKLC